MSNKPSFLIVFNICEIQRSNLSFYIKRIDNLLKLDYKKYHICISGCRVRRETKKALIERYANKVSFNFTVQKLTVQMTFNQTVEKCIQRFGEFNGYIYVESGIDIGDSIINLNILNEIAERYKTGKYGIISIQTDTDHGHHWILNQERLDNQAYILDEDFIIPPGKCCHLHFTVFTDIFYKKYNKLLPDIFNAWCIETTLSVMCAAIKTQWVIINTIIVEHYKAYHSQEGYDGATSGFNPEGGLYNCYWNNLYGGKNMINIMNDPTGVAAGFGYNDMDINGGRQVDKTQYDDNYHCINDELYTFCKEKLFLQQDELDYNFIVSNFLPYNPA